MELAMRRLGRRVFQAEGTANAKALSVLLVLCCCVVVLSLCLCLSGELEFKCFQG